MTWYEPYSAVLFDLDGLLVNTEAFHWQAYRDMVQQNGYTLTWDFDEYYSIASRSAQGVQNRLRLEYPGLFAKKAWKELYEEKRAALRVRIAKDPIPLMPGVEEVLQSLATAPIAVGVVTHSPQEFVSHVQRQHACFSVIQKWFPRESYLHPKPAPDGYIEACRFFEVEPHKAIGFEDSLRGIEALSLSGCKPVLVQMYDESARVYARERGLTVLTRIDEVLTEVL